MQSSFVVKRSFQHEVDCFCSEEKHSNIIQMQKGDRFVLSGERKYVEHLGWYFQIIVNEAYQVFILLSDIQQLYEHNLICSLLDLELAINYYEYKVNQSLDEKDKDTFDHYIQKLEGTKYLLNKRVKNYA